MDNVLICNMNTSPANRRLMLVLFCCVFLLSTPEVNTQENYNVRLVGGDFNAEGRVEIFYSNSWGTICDDEFGFEEANVVCHQLGYVGAVDYFDQAHYGVGTGSIWLDNVMCQGSELSIDQCSHNGWRAHNCGHSEDVGVACYTSDQYKVRLVGGPTQYEGRVEINYVGTWGTICDDNWDISEATVVCKQLGFTGALQAISLASTPYGAGEGAILLDDLNCQGREATLDMCEHIGWRTHDCSHMEDAGVICDVEDHIVRLEGGGAPNQGRVEVILNGNWSTVCDTSWDIQDANVVCRQLGFIGATQALSKAYFGEGSGVIALDEVRCAGFESELNDCFHGTWGQPALQCTHSNDAGIRCANQTELDIRLVGGDKEGAGRVEVFFNGRWGTVCDDLWDLPDARVVCRQLGYRDALEARSEADFGEGAGSIIMDNVECVGTEGNLTECVHNGFDQHNCRHDEDAGVVCLTEDNSYSIRLADGAMASEGRVEVSYNGQWGTICDDDWDIDDARVVCLQLGYSSAQQATTSMTRHFPVGIGQIWLDNVDCQGTESSIFHCTHNGWGINNCAHTEDAGVICTNDGSSEIRLVEGTDSRRGRLEVYFEGSWGTVCDDQWDTADAEVACRELGFPGVEMYKSDMFPDGTGAIWLDEVHCQGDESSIKYCSHIGWGEHNCDHTEDVGLVCMSNIGGSLNQGEIGGIVVAIFLTLFTVLLVCVVFCIRKKSPKPDASDNEPTTDSSSAPAPAPPAVYSINQSVHFNNFGQTVHVNADPTGGPPPLIFPATPFPPMPTEPPPKYEIISSYTPHSLQGASAGSSDVLGSPLDHPPNSTGTMHSGPRHSGTGAGAMPAPPVPHYASPPKGPHQGHLSSPIPDLVASGYPLPAEPPSYTVTAEINAPDSHIRGHPSAEGGAFTNPAFMTDSGAEDEDNISIEI